MTAPIILWFRSGLRLQDHPAVEASLSEAKAIGSPVLPLFIEDKANGTRPLGAAAMWWKARSLDALDSQLSRLGARLIIRQGDQKSVLEALIRETGARRLHADILFEPKALIQQFALDHSLRQGGISAQWHNATHLITPLSLNSAKGSPYQVFTPFFRAMMSSGALDPRLNSTEIPGWPAALADVTGLALSGLKLKPALPPSGTDWSLGFTGTPGESGAEQALTQFIRKGLKTYAEDRDRPDLDITSRLSSHLRFGEISPWRIIKAASQSGLPEGSLTRLMSQLAWREFSYQQLFQKSDLHVSDLKPGFEDMPWRSAPEELKAWKFGLTGYELVDAGMSQLTRQGWMHNRVRMVTASFLIKHLLIDWRIGEAWFWDRLTDADPANNPAGWQWVAGCGADAAPYFRIFNPISQAEKFDPDGTYRRQHLNYSLNKKSDLFDNKYVYEKSVTPIVDHSYARDRVLEAYESVRKAL